MSTPEPPLGPEPEPDWSRLPHDAAGFFALTEPIDRKELKRAYNRLIRRYKPERAPAEFQRIRAAYEQLDERLRYGESVADAPPVRWSRHGDDAGAPNQGPPPGVARRLEVKNAAEVYAELREKPGKTPYDYYALAVMADVVDPDHPLGFVRWLLAGLRDYPQDGALLRLLHGYLRGPVSDAAAQELLPEIASAVPTDAFYELTEPLWRTLLREQGTARFATLLAECQRHIRDHRIVGRMVFTIGMARAAMLLGDDPWTDEAVEYIDRNFEQIPPWLEQDVDMLGLLREYAQVREGFIAGRPLRVQIDAALRDYFSEDQQVGDRSVVACQVAITGDLAALAEAFPLEENELHRVFWPLWSWVSWDVAERHALPEAEESPEVDWLERVVDLVRLAAEEVNMMPRWVNYRTVWIVTLLSCGLIAVGMSMVLELVVPRHVAGSLRSVMMIALAIAAMPIIKSVEKRYWRPYLIRLASDHYRLVARPAALQFLRSSHLNDQAFRTLVGKTPSDIPMAVETYNAVRQDYAFPMLSVAQRFLA